MQDPADRLSEDSEEAAKTSNKNQDAAAKVSDDIEHVFNIPEVSEVTEDGDHNANSPELCEHNGNPSEDIVHDANPCEDNEEAAERPVDHSALDSGHMVNPSEADGVSSPPKARQEPSSALLEPGLVSRLRGAESWVGEAAKLRQVTNEIQFYAIENARPRPLHLKKF